MSEPREKTAAEASRALMDYLVFTARYWAETDLMRPEFARSVRTPEDEARYRVEGFLHSVLVAFSGCAGGLPFAVELRTNPHPDNTAFHQREGEDWWPAGAELEGLRELYAEMVRGPTVAKTVDQVHLESLSDSHLIGAIERIDATMRDARTEYDRARRRLVAAMTQKDAANLEQWRRSQTVKS